MQKEKTYIFSPSIRNTGFLPDSPAGSSQGWQDIPLLQWMSYFLGRLFSGRVTWQKGCERSEKQREGQGTSRATTSRGISSNYIQLDCVITSAQKELAPSCHHAEEHGCPNPLCSMGPFSTLCFVTWLKEVPQELVDGS